MQKKYRKILIGVFVLLIVSIIVYVSLSHEETSTSSNISSMNGNSASAIEEYYRVYVESYVNSNLQVVEEELTVFKVIIDDENIFYLETIEEVENAFSSIIMRSDDTIISAEVSIENNLNDGDIEVDVEVEAEKESVLSVEYIERTFVTSPMNGNLDGSLQTDSSTGALGENLLSVYFYENVVIEPVTLNNQTLASVEEMITDLLKLNVTPDEYIIQSGDSASVIAEVFDMSLRDLYELNPWLEERERSLQVGDEVIVEKLIPELNVVYCKEAISNEEIAPEVEYVEDETIYLGLEVVDNPGLNGIMEVTKDIDVLNGEVISEEVINQEIVMEAQNQVILIGTKPTPEDGPAGFFVIPLNSYRLSSSYGPRWGRTHRGIDMAVSSGTNVLASDGGTVIFSGWDGGYGYKIDIDHGNGIVTRYAHNSLLLVEVGEVVGQGEVIAKSGNTGNSTGPHLHFEMIVDGTAENPFDYFN
jgi:murein DD-endopeptidase MepM/ murein hydrolase activator NlpD